MQTVKHTTNLNKLQIEFLTLTDNMQPSHHILKSAILRQCNYHRELYVVTIIKSDLEDKGMNCNKNTTTIETHQSKTTHSLTNYFPPTATSSDASDVACKPGMASLSLGATLVSPFSSPVVPPAVPEVDSITDSFCSLL
jgi:hypothetical protein